MDLTLSEALSLVLALVLGAIIGAEREFNRKSAGLRTNILICLGAAVFTIMSKKIAVGDDDTPSRIAAQIVTGIGFLGAGAIIQDTGGIHGMTTAATIWIVASIGMACGAGYNLLAVVATLLTIAVLFAFAPLTKILGKHAKKRKEAQKNKKTGDE